MGSDYCYITDTKDGIFIEGAYNPEFVESLKSHVPAGHRSYDPELRRWWVDLMYMRQARIDVKACYNEVFEV